LQQNTYEDFFWDAIAKIKAFMIFVGENSRTKTYHRASWEKLGQKYLAPSKICIFPHIHTPHGIVYHTAAVQGPQHIHTSSNSTNPCARSELSSSSCSIGGSCGRPHEPLPSPRPLTRGSGHCPATITSVTLAHELIHAGQSGRSGTHKIGRGYALQASRNCANNVNAFFRLVHGNVIPVRIPWDGMGQHPFVLPMRLRNRMRVSECYWTCHT